MENKLSTSAKIFLNCVIPLLKEIILRTNLVKKIKSLDAIIQISTLTREGKWGTHLVIKDGEIKTVLGLYETKAEENADGSESSPIKKPKIVELEFSSIEHFVAFFKNQSKKLPKIKGIKNLSLFIFTMQALLKMASLLQAKEPPKSLADKELLTMLYLYLLPSGISQLNKLQHPAVSEWTKTSPDRVFAWTVDGYEDIASHLRVKAGNSKASRGKYTRSKPFFTMRFADIDSALDILLERGDLLKFTAEQKLIMEGAPEFGAKIGDFMLLVGSFAK